MAVKMRIMVNRNKFEIKVRNYEKSKTKSFNKIQHRDTGSQSAKG
jgi:hypothetical protein